MKINFVPAKLPVALLCLGLAAVTASAGLFGKKEKPAPAPAPAPEVTNTPPPVVEPPKPAEPPKLDWDSDVKESRPEIGMQTADVSFWLTNTSSVEAVVSSVTTSCGCTTAHLPPMPWTLTPGSSGKIDVSVNLAGKSGTLIKTVTVNSTAGMKSLQVRVVMPDPQAARDRNMMAALADRQEVFKGNCATCHVPAGLESKKDGADIYNAVCGVCHEAQHRATMVADLHNLPHPTDAQFWRTWIIYGKPHSLMPAFAKSQGGPLTDAQVDALVDFLSTAEPFKSKAPSLE